jgi:two-component system, NarL family, response regulator LiaR
MAGRALSARDERTRLIIADDHDLVRSGMRNILATFPDLEVVGEARDGQEALEACRLLKPDLILMDVRMPRMDGILATREIKRELPGVCVLMVTMHDNPDYMLEAIRAGAAGYVLKETPVEDLVAVVRRTVAGEHPLDDSLAFSLIRRLAGEMRGSRVENGPPDVQLDRREMAVLRLLVRGMTNREISNELELSEGTTKASVRSILVKLGVSDRTQAAVKAIRLGLLEPEV